MADTDNSTDSSIYAHPSMADFYTNMSTFMTLAIFISILILILNVSIFCTTLASLRKRLPSHLLGLSVALCSLYPLISLAAVITILVPKVWLICHSVMHLSFTVGAVMFQRLCLRYVGSPLNYLKESDGAAVAINTPPCCCCCMCLPMIEPTRTRYTILRYMVWQMPLVQGAIMLVLNVVYFQEPPIYTDVMFYFTPFIITSILIGLWSLKITVGMLTKIHAEYGLVKKLFCLQLVLLLCKLQYLVLDSQLKHFNLGGPYPINHTIYKQTIINLLILTEMILVSLLVQGAYKTPTQVTEK